MDPFSSFDLFRRRVDQMFSDFDQHLFGTDPALGLFEAPRQLGQQSLEQSKEPQATLGHERSTSLSAQPKEEEERIIPTTTRTPGTSRSLTTRPSDTQLGLWTSLSNMKMDLIEEKDKFIVHADVPGFTKDQIKLSIKDGMLNVSGETSNQREENDPDRRYHRLERSSGSISRSIRLPEHIKEDEIMANCENGVLKVVIPKDLGTEKKKEKKIRVH